MTPLERFGALVLLEWQEHDGMDLDGSGIQDMAEKARVIVLVPYSIEKHGEYMRDELGMEEGDEISVMAPGVSDAVDAAHPITEG